MKINIDILLRFTSNSDHLKMVETIGAITQYWQKRFSPVFIQYLQTKFGKKKQRSVPEQFKCYRVTESSVDASLQSIVGFLMVKRGGKSGLTLSSPKTCKKRNNKKNA